MLSGYLGHTRDVLIPGEGTQFVVVPGGAGLEGTECLGHPDVQRPPPLPTPWPSRAVLRTAVVTYRCKRFGVPVEKIYNKTQRERFAWAFNQAGEDFEF